MAKQLSAKKLEKLGELLADVSKATELRPSAERNDYGDTELARAGLRLTSRGSF
jgi:hypothetical protein